MISLDPVIFIFSLIAENCYAVDHSLSGNVFLSVVLCCQQVVRYSSLSKSHMKCTDEPEPAQHGLVTLLMRGSPHADKFTSPHSGSVQPFSSSLTNWENTFNHTIAHLVVTLRFRLQQIFLGTYSLWFSV